MRYIAAQVTAALEDIKEQQQAILRSRRFLPTEVSSNRKRRHSQKSSYSWDTAPSRVDSLGSKVAPKTKGTPYEAVYLHPNSTCWEVVLFPQIRKTPRQPIV